LRHDDPMYLLMLCYQQQLQTAPSTQLFQLIENICSSLDRRLIDEQDPIHNNIDIQALHTFLKQSISNTLPNHRFTPKQTDNSSEPTGKPPLHETTHSAGSSSSATRQRSSYSSLTFSI
ncbi:MAG: hypothetical protein VYD39_04945, partial [Bacteroidota bacterium]|nr:hypothetical protein [Bacteroidota bacterium]